MPAARTFTGDGCGCKFRPLGRSGCVTTAAMVKADDSRSADKLAQASSAVPKKTMRSGDMQRRREQICDRENQSFSARDGVGQEEDEFEAPPWRQAPEPTRYVLPTNSRNPNKDIRAIRRRAGRATTFRAPAGRVCSSGNRVRWR